MMTWLVLSLPLVCSLFIDKCLQDSDYNPSEMSDIIRNEDGSDTSSEAFEVTYFFLFFISFLLLYLCICNVGKYGFR